MDPRLPLNVNQEFATLRDDGAYVFGGRNLHSAATHLFSVNQETGQMNFTTVPNVENGFTVPGFEIGVAQGFAEDEAELAVITRRLNGAQAGVHQAEIFRLAADGRPIASYQTTETRIVPSPDGQGNLTLAEDVIGISALDGTLAANLNIGMTGEERVVLIQRNTMTERWSFALPAGSTSPMRWNDRPRRPSMRKCV